MVSEMGQIFTIEGLAAGVLLIVTAYIVVSTTSVLTPQDVHIIDMQLEQLGNDALAVMDVKETPDGESLLSQYVRENNVSGFYLTLESLVQKRADVSDDFNLKYRAKVYYRIPGGSTITEYVIPGGNFYYNENAVVVSRWVYLKNGVNVTGPHPMDELGDGPHTVLIEVLLWRG
jgi:hypothetical protein